MIEIIWRLCYNPDWLGQIADCRLRNCGGADRDASVREDWAQHSTNREGITLKHRHHVGTLVPLLAMLLLGGCSSGGQIGKADPADCIIPADGGTVRQVTDLSVGEIVTFGAYEQDADPSTDAEKIEWIVLDVEEHRALLLSRRVLDTMPFNESQKRVPWKGCTLRKWLNKEFYEKAFSAPERSLIAETQLKNDDFIYILKATNTDTTDKIFPLSFAELHAYCGVEGERFAEATPYAQSRATPYAQSEKLKGIESVSVDEGYFDRNLKEKNVSRDVIGRTVASFWVRSNADGWKTAGRTWIVDAVGGGGTGVYLLNVGVRPALYVSW